MTWSGKKTPTSDPQSTAVISRLSPASTRSIHLVPCRSIVQVLLGTIYIPSPVEDQFWWNLFHLYCSYHLSQKLLLQFPEFCNSMFAFGGHDLSLDKFVLHRSEYAQSTFSSMCTPYSASIDLSQVRRMPLAAATSIFADITPPHSLTFLQVHLHLLI